MAVISDVHANACALREGIHVARERGVDQLVLAGDLLTYGCEPTEVLELVAELSASTPVVLLQGNHDQLYFDLLDGRSDYYDTLPGWIQESVTWTAERLDLRSFRGLPWQPRHVSGDVFFAHANPFTYGDWTYLSADAEIARAASTLVDNGFLIGVFGHTHRARLSVLTRDGTMNTTSTSLFLDEGALSETSAVVANAGSIGQPRNRQKQATMLLLQVDPGGVGFDLVNIQHQSATHTDAIRRSELSDQAKERILTYLEGPA